MEKLLKAVLWLGVIAFGIGGAWAFGWPESFYENVATYPPFNTHLFHDAGAFQLGIAAALLGALVWRDVLLIGLFGGMVGTVVHAISHVMDVNLGDSPGDPWSTLAQGIVFAVAFVLRLTMRRKA